MQEQKDKQGIRLNDTYKIIDRKTNQEMGGAFVLFPAKDLAARKALETYANETHSEKISRWLKAWLRYVRTGIERRIEKKNLSGSNSD